MRRYSSEILKDIVTHAMHLMGRKDKPTKDSLLKKLNHICDLAKRNQIKDCQKTFFNVYVLATAYSSLTRDADFPARLNGPFLVNSTTDEVIYFRDTQLLQGMSPDTFDTVIPPDDKFFVLLEHTAWRLTDHDIYLALRHALAGLKTGTK